MIKLPAKIFPYQKNPQGQIFPIIPVTLVFKRKKFDTSALIDSGATVSIFKDEVANQLEIDIEKGTEIFLGGVGGRIKGYLHNLQVELSGKTFLLPTVFSYEYLVSLNLLGRSSFFAKFLITFNENGKQIKLV